MADAPAGRVPPGAALDHLINNAERAMSRANDRRIVLGKQNDVLKTKQRLVAAQERAEPLLLSLHEVSNLVTVLEAATRIAAADNHDEGTSRRSDRSQSATETLLRSELAECRLELAKTTHAWQAAERLILERELAK